MIVTPTLAVLVTASLLLLVLKQFLFRTHAIRLPPGPPKLPLVGNVADRPPAGCKEWEYWFKFKSRFGPISSLTTMGQTIVILNDATTALDLLEKRANFHSSRPQTVVIAELTGWNRMVTLQGNWDIIRDHRRRIQHFIGSPTALANLAHMLDLEARRFLLRAYERPARLMDHIRLQTGSTILKLTYGYNVDSSKRDPLIRVADLSTAQFSVAAQPGAWLIDSLPLLKYLPEWCPGASVKKLAREWRLVLETLADKPFEFALRLKSKRPEEKSYVSQQLDILGHPPDSYETGAIKWTAATLYGAGADTTVSALSTFYLAMMLFPDIQRTAQKELDTVIGPTRLPTLDDRDSLPYINALLWEVIRWHPVAPLGVPHMAMDDDYYNGYCIPKGAVLIANIWAITRDPNIYSSPETFNPARFLQSDTHTAERDPRKFVFGFGRRICLGRHFAELTLFLSISKALAVFNMRPIADNDNQFEATFLPGIISHPAEYKIDLLPRSAKAKDLIHSLTFDEVWTEGDASMLNNINKFR